MSSDEQLGVLNDVGIILHSSHEGARLSWHCQRHCLINESAGNDLVEIRKSSSARASEFRWKRRDGMVVGREMLCMNRRLEFPRSWKAEGVLVTSNQYDKCSSMR